MKRFAIAAPALLLAACGTATHTGASTTAPPPAGPKTVIDSHGAYWSVIDNDGTFVVGVDLWAAKYRSAGGTACYWARLRSLDPSDIIDNKNTNGPQAVQIRLSDAAFLTRNCGTWQQIP